MDGVLVIDKPAGPSSHDIVAWLRRVTGWTKVGHTGTLDPMATGVLPLVVGRATRLAQFLTAADKVYEAEVRVGWATDTYDAQGERIEIETSEVGGPTFEVRDPATDVGHLEQILDRFRGTYEQVAPAFSAKKIEGVRAYELARRGKPFAPKAASVTVHHLRLLGWEGDRFRFRIHCSAGFYVRSFAHELGRALGTGAHLSALRRTRSGDFDEAAAVRPETIEQSPGAAASLLLPLERMLESLPRVTVTEQGAVRTRHGNELRPQDMTALPAADGPVLVVDGRGAVLAVAHPCGKPGFLHPGIVVM